MCLLIFAAMTLFCDHLLIVHIHTMYKYNLDLYDIMSSGDLSVLRNQDMTKKDSLNHFGMWNIDLLIILCLFFHLNNVFYHNLMCDVIF